MHSHLHQTIRIVLDYCWGSQLVNLPARRLNASASHLEIERNYSQRRPSCLSRSGNGGSDNGSSTGYDVRSEDRNGGGGSGACGADNSIMDRGGVGDQSGHRRASGDGGGRPVAAVVADTCGDDRGTSDASPDGGSGGGDESSSGCVAVVTDSLKNHASSGEYIESAEDDGGLSDGHTRSSVVGDDGVY